MQAIMVDYAELETFSNHLVDSFPELFSVAEALLNLLVEGCKMVASGRHMNFMKNLTGENWGLQRFAWFNLPVYEQISQILHAGEKEVFLHFDG